jgi:hypothetical protein
MEAAVGFSFLGKLRVLLGSTPAINPPSADGALKGYNLELAKGFEPPTL